MSDDLISRSELIQTLDNAFSEGLIDSVDDIIGIVEETPTAYDVDKVVEQLEELIYPNLANNYKYVVNKCIEIVKAGGKV